MAELTLTELIKKIKSDDLCNIYYIYGQDILSVENASKAILKKRLGKNWTNEVTRINGSELDVNSFVDMIEICPMFSEYNAFLINDLNADTLDDFDMLIKAIGNLPEYSIIVINITGFDVKKGKKVMSGKNKKLADSISKNGIVCECALKSAAVLSKAVIDKAQKNGCSISKKAAEMLVDMCRCDAMIIANELEKLCAYREKAEIRIEDIDEMVEAGIETDAFKLSRAIVSLNPSLSMQILNRLIEKKEEPIAIIAAVSMSFIDLYRARAAINSNKRANDVVEDFNYGNRKFSVDNSFRDSPKISLESLRQCIELLRNADRKLKQTGGMGNIILEKTVTEMLMAVKRR